MCRRTRFAACETFRTPAGAAFGFGEAGGGFGGGLSDRLSVPEADHLLLGLPEGLAPTTACTIPDNLTDAWRAVGPALAADPGSDVLVVGGLAASIGLYTVIVALALGAGTVRYVDDDEERVEVARSLGADANLVTASERSGEHLDSSTR